jgi:hypothetical protein
MKTLDRVTKQVSAASAPEKGNSTAGNIYSNEGDFQKIFAEAEAKLEKMRHMPEQKKPQQLELVVLSQMVDAAQKMSHFDEVSAAYIDIYELIRHNPRFQPITEALKQFLEAEAFLNLVHAEARRI